jgi:hypothetical protein
MDIFFGRNFVDIRDYWQVEFGFLGLYLSGLQEKWSGERAFYSSAGLSTQ